MAMSNANLAVTLKRAAQNVSEIVKKQNRIKEQMADLEEKLRKQLKEKLSKLKMELEELEQQQEIFEKPVREFTGGYCTSDLIRTEVVEMGTDKNGKVIRKTVYNLIYPDTIIPQAPAPQEEPEAPVPTFAKAAEESVSNDEDLPFSV